MDTLEDHDNLKHILSKVPVSPVLWTFFLEKLTEKLGCQSGVILVSDLFNKEDTRFLYLQNIPAGHQSLYEQKFNRLDSFNEHVAKHPYTVFCSQTLPEACFNQMFEEKFMIPYGYQYRYGFSIPYNRHYSLCLHFSRNTPFDALEQQQSVRILQAVIPAIENALHTEQWQTLYKSCLHQTGGAVCGYVIVDRTLKILFTESIFSSMIATMDCLQLAGNRLNILNKSVEQRVIAGMTAMSCETISLPGQCPPWFVTIIPVSVLDSLYAWEFHKDGFILAFSHGTEKNPAITRLMAVHNLTRCEAIYALHFLETPSIIDIADHSCRSVETVRNHIKKIMQKLNVHNQAALMKKLLAVASL